MSTFLLVTVGFLLVALVLKGNSEGDVCAIAAWRDAKTMFRQGKGCRGIQTFKKYQKRLVEEVTRALEKIPRSSFSTTFLVNNPIFGPQKVFFTETTVLSPEDCRSIVKASNDVSEKFGYTTRNATVQTRDQTVARLPKTIQDMIFNALRSCIVQYAESVVDLNPHPDYNEMFPGGRTFVIRYDGGKEGAMDCKPHTDCNDLLSASVVINLSPKDGFVGGGTEFYESNPVLQAKVARPSQGQGVVFNGTKMLHGGAPVESGERYVLVALFERRFNAFHRFFGGAYLRA